MGTATAVVAQSKDRLYKRAFLLAQITIFYNLVEGSVSVFFGVEAVQALALEQPCLDEILRHWNVGDLKWISICFLYSY
jgi:hypothetical protein